MLIVRALTIWDLKGKKGKFSAGVVSITSFILRNAHLKSCPFGLHGSTLFLRCKMQFLFHFYLSLLCAVLDISPSIFIKAKHFSATTRFFSMFFSVLKKKPLLFCTKTRPYRVWCVAKMKINQKWRSFQNLSEVELIPPLAHPLLKARESIMVLCVQSTGAVWGIKAADTHCAGCSKQFPLYIQSSCSMEEVLWRTAEGAVGWGANSSNKVLHPNKRGCGCGCLLSGLVPRHNLHPCIPIIVASKSKSRMNPNTCNVYTNTQRSCYN